jgi:predicted secreted hydrolase
MMTKTRIVFILGLVGLLLVGLFAALTGHENSGPQAQLVAQIEPVGDFSRATGPQPLVFPADHGAHPDYQTEWWYYTGNLQTNEGRHFGYQLTIFRSALKAPNDQQDRPSSWAADQIYMGHFAVTDVATERHEAFERFSRGAAGLAGAQAPPHEVWLEDWRIEELAPRVYRLRASQDEVALDLQLTDLKGPVLQGENGYSQKGPEPGNASYYYSLTRLASAGRIHIGDTIYDVDGLSWMDHEFSTSALGSDLVGWDWFSIQLDDGSELMLYQFRKADGTIDRFSNGTIIDPSGQTTSLSHDAFRVSSEATWHSPRSGASYPSEWIITVPDEELTLMLKPHVADQEMNVSITYWEGAVKASGTRNGRPVTGNGYVELTGYAHSMQDRL